MNGFDRAGGSAITRLLSQHPKIQLLFQPFNSSNLRTRMYEIITDKNVDPIDQCFIEKLNNSYLDISYIESHWFYKYSTTEEITKDNLYIIKTTLNHLTVRWMSEQFHNIDQWGIWRDPFDILNSLVVNNFHNKWYSDGYEKTLALVNSEAIFNHFKHLTKYVDSKIHKMAFIISMRSWYYFSHINRNKILVYERFLKEPQKELNKFLKFYELDTLIFKDVFKDRNIVGKAFKKKKKKCVINREDFSLKRIFSPLVYIQQQLSSQSKIL